MNQWETTSSTEDSPPDFRLHQSLNGWSGGNERFRVVDNMIKIKKSDADPKNVPSEQQRRKLYDESGNFSQHVQQFKGDPVFQLWMTKIGPYLADWVLDKRNDPTALRLPWQLLGFPPGYTLWVHLTGDKSDPANPRTDAYLHGSAHKIFRSPMEFVEHAIWLMKSGSVGDQCLCKYCAPGQSQRAINRRLDRRDDDESDDDDGDGSSSDGGAPVATAADIRASRHKLFRNRPGAGAIAAAAARQSRRQDKRRERPSMQIKAKDYRVGNVGGSSGGGGSGAAP